MSVRYTSQGAEAAPPAQAAYPSMDKQGLRDVDRWKDKIEVRLDNRQVAFLFFGSALVACMLFILGVIVGKRLESRGRALAPEIEDPLALLDRVASTSQPEEAARSAEPPPAGGAPARARKAQAPAARGEAAPGPRGEAGPAPGSESAPPSTRGEPKTTPQPTRPNAAAAKAAADPAAQPVPPRPATSPRPEASDTQPATRGAAAPSDRQAAARTEPPAAEPSPVKPAPVTPPPPVERRADILPPSFDNPGSPAPAAAGKARFMLQVGSFADRAEAEAFATTLAAERPTVIQSEIPGKGTWFRVRLGAFQNFKEAVEAKMVFERRYNKIALVVGPL